MSGILSGGILGGSGDSSTPHTHLLSDIIGLPTTIDSLFYEIGNTQSIATQATNAADSAYYMAVSASQDAYQADTRAYNAYNLADGLRLGTETAPRLTTDTLTYTASAVSTLTASRSLTNADNGKRLHATGTSDLTLTLPSGLTAGHCLQLTNLTTTAGTLTLAPSSTTINGSTRPIKVPRGVSLDLIYTGSNTYRTRATAPTSPRAGRLDATDPSDTEDFQQWYVEDNVNNSAVFNFGGIYCIPGPFAWSRTSGDSFTGGGLTAFTDTSVDAVAEWQSGISGGTYDRASTRLSFDISPDPSFAENIFGWSDQFGSAGDYIGFGFYNNTEEPPQASAGSGA